MEFLYQEALHHFLEVEVDLYVCQAISQPSGHSMDVIYQRKIILKTFSIYLDWWKNISFSKFSIYRQRQIIFLPRSLISNSFIGQLTTFESSLVVPIILKSSIQKNYNKIISRPFCKITRTNRVVSYPSFSKNWLKWLYHILP